MPAKKSKEQVLLELEERNRSNPIIVPVDNNFVYHNTNQKIDWKCTENHVFNTTFKNILKGHGCKKCGRLLVGVKNQKSKSLLLKRLSNRNTKYPDKLVKIKNIDDYTGMTKPLTWICTKGHEWNTTPKSVLLSGSYCRKCADQKNADNQRLTQNNILEKIKEHNTQHPTKVVHLNSLTNYINNKSKVSFQCDNGHIWSTPLGFIIDSHVGCPTCARAGYSLKAIEWLTDISNKNGIEIQHAMNGGEYLIPGSNYRADGYCVATNTIYEFHGDIYHGNPMLFSRNDISEIDNTKTYGELYDNTLMKEQFIRDNGYNLVVLWESEYDSTLKHTQQLQQIIDFITTYNINIVVTSEYDILLPDLKIAINYRSLVLHTHNKLGDMEYHKRYHTQATEHNIRLITIFSHEWKYSKTKVKDTLRYVLGHAERGVAARHTTIREIEWSECKLFLNKFHLLNAGAATVICLGAFYNETLIAVMTFGKPPREQGTVAHYEMTRFVTDKKTHPGLGSKMFKHATTNYELNEVIAFVDKRWFAGNFKVLSGFTVMAETKPTLWYTDGKKLFNRRFITRKRLISELDAPPNSTKDTMLLSLGYQTMYDCGKIKMVWTK